MRRSIDGLMRDLRIGIRAWRRSPGPFGLVVITLAIGIACNVVAFSLVRTLLIRPYPFRDLERLVLLRETRAGDATLSTRLTPADARDIARETSAFDEFAEYRFRPMSLAAADGPMRVRSFAVSPNFFRLFGVDAALGRALTPAGGSAERHVALLSHGLWQRLFGGAPGIVGQTIVMNGEAYDVVGVMAPSFTFPRGVDVWVPHWLTPDEERERVRPSLSAVARVRPRTTISEARAELDRYSLTLAARHPATNTGRRLLLLRLREEQYEYTLPLFSMLQFAALFVLFVAAVNASSIYVAQQLARRREMALRLALGATRGRLLAAGLAEGMLLAGLGAGIAIVVSWWTVRVARDALPRGIAIFVAGWDALGVDGAVLGFSIALALLVGLLIGWISTLRLPTSPLAALGNMREPSATSSRRIRRLTVAAQLVTALVLGTAGASIESGVRRLANVFDAFAPDQVLIAGVTLAAKRYSAPSSQTIFFSRLLDSLRALPGTEAVAVVSNLPASNVPNARSSFVIERRPPQSPSEMPSADLQTVGGALFPLLRVPILRGRDLLESDVGGSMPAIVVSEAMARTYWPNENPLGQRIRLGSWKEDGPWWTIVGVAGDIRQNWFDPTPRAIAYVSVRQRPVRTMTVMVRTANDPRALVQPLKDHLVRIDSTLPMSEIATLRDEVDDSLAPLRIIGALLVTFALVTFALAGIGVYGVVTGTVARQTREFGIRMTLGAGPSRIQAEVLGETLRVVSWSAAIGIPVSMAVQSLGASTLYGLVTMSAATPIAATGSVLLLSLIAALVPARRAAALDPAVALRAGDSQW